MSGERKLLARSGGVIVPREKVFQAADGLEIDTSEHYEIVRRRVFYDDVTLVTYHSDRGLWYLLLTGIVGALFTTMGMIIVNAGAWPASVVFFMFAIPADILFLVRLIAGRDVITVFGRRSKAVLRFSALRRRRARAIYDEICAAVREAQAAASVPEPAAPPPAPMPEGVPLPPAK